MSVPAEMMGAPPVEAPMGPPPVAGEMAPPPVGPEEGGPPPSSPLEPEEELDADIALGMMLVPTFADEGTDQIMKVVEAENPAPLLANMAVTLVNQINEQMKGRMPLSERMWLAEGGAVDRWIDNVEELLEKDGFEIDERLKSMIMSEVVDQLKIAGQAEKNGAAAGAPPPVGPDQGPPPPGAMGPPPPGAGAPPPPMMGV